MSSAKSYPGVIAAAILTGGQARRLLGQDKSRLVTGADGRTILQRQLDMLAPLTSEILIVTSAERFPAFAPFDSRIGHPPIRIVSDHYPRTGPLGAVITALETAQASDVLVVGGDMPNVTAQLVGGLTTVHRRDGNLITVAQSSRGLEPLAAIYARAAREPLLEAMNAGQRSLQRAVHLPKLGVIAAHSLVDDEDPDALFRNINTPEDL